MIIYETFFYDSNLFGRWSLGCSSGNLNMLKMVGNTSRVMLVWARVGLIFLVTAVGPGFGFVLETMVIIQRHLHYCCAALTQSRGFFCYSPHPTSEEAGGTEPGQLTPTDQRKIPYHMDSYSTRWTRRSKRVMFRMMMFVFLSHGYVGWNVFFLGVAEHLSTMGSGELVPCLIWLCVWPLLSLLNCFYLNPQRVFWQFFCCSLPNPSEGKENAQLHEAVSDWR